MTLGPFLRRLRLRNFKIISLCDVELGQLTLLVGRNGSGKSNFLEALRFVSDGLNLSLDHAIKSRGGIDAVRRGSVGHPHRVGIELSISVADHFATYGFEIAWMPTTKVTWERLVVHDAQGRVEGGYSVTDGRIAFAQIPGTTAGSNLPVLAPPLPDRLYLVFAAGISEFRTYFDCLRSMVFYHFDPRSMKALQPTEPSDWLSQSGSNIATVVGRMQTEQPEAFGRIQEYLSHVVPGIVTVRAFESNGHSGLRFGQQMQGSNAAWEFPANLMSDGTVNALGTLVAVNQLNTQSDRPQLVGIEEAETALHPAATAALLDALREAATHTQLVVTTHSPDLLDRADLDFEQVLVLQAIGGKTDIAPLDKASRETIRSHLYSAGELLRMDQLQPDHDDLARQSHLPFFAEAEVAP